MAQAHRTTKPQQELSEAVSSNKPFTPEVASVRYLVTVMIRATVQALWVDSNLWAGDRLAVSSSYHFRMGPLPPCSAPVWPCYSLSWSPVTGLEAASEDHVVLGTMTARLSAALAKTRYRSVCGVTVMVSGLREMALCEGRRGLLLIRERVSKSCRV